MAVNDRKLDHLLLFLFVFFFSVQSISLFFIYKKGKNEKKMIVDNGNILYNFVFSREWKNINEDDNIPFLAVFTFCL